MVSPVRIRVSPLKNTYKIEGNEKAFVLKRGPITATVPQPVLGKNRVYLPCRLTLRRGQHVEIGTQGDRNAEVTQEFLHHLRM